MHTLSPCIGPLSYRVPVSMGAVGASAPTIFESVGASQTCADPAAILKNFTFLEFEFFVLKILTDFLTLTDL